MKLKKKVALVTRSSRSIGKGIAQALAKEGALVVINYVSNQNAAEATVKEIEDAGGQAFAVKGNIGSLQEIEQLFVDMDTQLQRLRFPVNHSWYIRY
ncbi:MAG: SDR family NAD(P)-dependent oxidoreductase [Cyanobacteria bacterium J06643_5]